MQSSNNADILSCKDEQQHFRATERESDKVRFKKLFRKSGPVRTLHTTKGNLIHYHLRLFFTLTTKRILMKFRLDLLTQFTRD